MGVSGKVWAGAAAALLVGGACAAALLYASPRLFSKAEAPAGQKSDLARFAVGPLARLQTPAVAAPATDHGFVGPQGEAVTLADFRGRVVVVNLWAMWCAPCRTEMPTLAALAGRYADRADFAVVAVNVESGDEAGARAFLADHPPLIFYRDPAFKLPFLFEGRGAMPQTVLIDRRGRIRAALTGEADWDGAEARALVEALLAEPE